MTVSQEDAMDGTDHQHANYPKPVVARRDYPVLFTLSDLRLARTSGVPTSSPAPTVDANIETHGAPVAEDVAEQRNVVPLVDTDCASAVKHVDKSSVSQSEGHATHGRTRRRTRIRTHSKTHGRTHGKKIRRSPRRTPPKPSLWSRIAASLFVLMLMGVAYLAFRGPEIPDTNDGTQPLLLNVTDVADKQDMPEDKAWNNSPPTVDLARRQDGLSVAGPNAANDNIPEVTISKPSFDSAAYSDRTSSDPTTIHTATPSEVPSVSYSQRPNEPTAVDESKLSVDQKSDWRDTESTSTSPPNWNVPANPAVPWNASDEAAPAENSVTVQPSATTSTSLDQSKVTGSSNSLQQAALTVPQYPSTGMVAEVPSRPRMPVIEKSKQMIAPVKPTQPSTTHPAVPSMRHQSRYAHDTSHLHIRRESAVPEAARLRGTIENPYIGRNYDARRSSLY